MIIFLLANGFEEIEALTPVDILRREGYEVKTVGISGKSAIGSHGIEVVCDALPSDIDLSKVDLAVFPGGMPGALNLDGSEFTDKVINRVLEQGGHLAAICAAPLIFGRRGLLSGRRSTCFSGFEGELRGATVLNADVVTDGCFTTGRGMTVSLEFARELVRVLKERPNRDTAPRENEGEVSMVATEYTAPPLDLLKAPSADDGAIAAESEKMAEKLVENFESLGYSVTVTGITQGPRLTSYKVLPEKAIRVSELKYLDADLSLYLCVEGLRILLPTSGEKSFTVEIPNKNSRPVYLRELLECEKFSGASSKTTVCIGKSTTGENVLCDIHNMPHLLVSGVTGVGKSVCINSILASLLYKATPDEVKLILIDPKQVEFNFYNGIPHLITPVITDMNMAVGALRWAIGEMERRYQLISGAQARHLDGYNLKCAADPKVGKPLPKIIIVIDELSDLMMFKRGAAEGPIMRIAQKARAAGIHLIIGTQRPSPSVITGVIKANIPTRICFKVSSQIDSRTVLEVSGAEKLLNSGDMLFSLAGSPSPVRVQGAYISDSEIQAITDHLKGFPIRECVTEEIKKETEKLCASPDNYDELADEDDEEASYLDDDTFLDAVDTVIRAGKASTSLLQRKLSIGYGKAAKYIDVMCELGVISESCGAKPRDVLITADEWAERLDQLS